MTRAVAVLGIVAVVLSLDAERRGCWAIAVRIFQRHIFAKAEIQSGESSAHTTDSFSQGTKGRHMAYMR
jgi:hypothetical protein